MREDRYQYTIQKQKEQKKALGYEIRASVLDATWGVGGMRVEYLHVRLLLGAVMLLRCGFLGRVNPLQKQRETWEEKTKVVNGIERKTKSRHMLLWIQRER